MEDPKPTEPKPIEPANIQNYFSALVQAYGVLHPHKTPKAKTHASASGEAKDIPVIAEDRKSLIYDIKLHILALETEASAAKPATSEEKRRLRKLETRLELYRVRLEKLEAQETQEAS